MATLNKGASDAMVEVGVNASTDVTGFGLLGHLSQMMKSSGLSANLNWSKIPILPDVVELAQSGNISGGTTRNIETIRENVIIEDGLSDLNLLILADAQTSGGLLISVSEERSEGLVNKLVDNQTLYSSVIGKVTEGHPGAITVRK
jgi:selenide,water dikinase